MPIDPNIILQARPIDLGQVGQSALQGLTFRENVKNAETDRNFRQQQANADQDFRQKQLGLQEAEQSRRMQSMDIEDQLRRQQVTKAAFDNASEREKQRLSSSIYGAAQLNSYLEANDIEGAKQFLETRKKNLGARIAQGDNVDTRETEEALQLLEKNPEQLKNLTGKLMGFGEQLGILKNPKENIPSSVREYDFYKKLSPQEQQNYLDVKRDNKGLVLNTDGTISRREGYNQAQSDTKAAEGFGKRVGEDTGKYIVNLKQSANDANKTLTSNEDARKLLDSGVITGFGSTYALGFGKALQKIGFNQSDDAISNTEAFVALRAKEVGRIIKDFGAGTGLSDADREFATKAAAGDITLNESSIRKILAISDKLANETITIYNQEVKNLPNGGSAYAPEIKTKQNDNSGGYKGYNYTIE
jgi:hypothetical protein